MSTPSISVLIVDNEEPFLDLLQKAISQEGYAVETANDGVAAINKLQSKSYDLVLTNLKMPRVDGLEVLKFVKEHYFDTQVIMLAGVNDISIAVECMKSGAFDFVTKPYGVPELPAVVERALERKKLAIENKVLKAELSRHSISGQIIGNSRSFVEVLNVASKVAPTDSTVLIQGASGTGKELIASFLHRNSIRKNQQFVALNCASMPEMLIESELFGHEKGAFTDAIAMKQGLVEIANCGTLFLDEIGEISLMVQPKLLRFLQTGEYRRVGGNKTLKADVRVISATNKDLRDEVEQGTFREDLLSRINVILLQIPSLKDRREDIPLLVGYFLKKRVRSKEPNRIDQKALELLEKYDWPGNIRELENVIERAGILCQDNVIRTEDLALPLGRRSYQEQRAAGTGSGSLLGTLVSIREVEKAHIHGVLKTVNWNKNTAAEILEISLKTLYTKIQQYNLSKE